MLKKLKARLAKIESELKSLVGVIEAADDYSEEQETQLKALNEEHAKVKAQIGDLESAADLSTGAGTQAGGQQIIDVQDNAQQDPMRGFADMGEFAMSVRAALNPSDPVADERLNSIVAATPSNFHRETASTDGYMVPPAAREEIWRLVFEGEGILPLVSPEPTNSNHVSLLADESTPWSSSGIQAKWASEGTKFDPSKLSTEARNVQLHKLYAFVLATEELVADAPRLASRLSTQAAEAISFKADEAIIEGDGKGKPLGFRKSGALVTVAKEGSQTADTIVQQNVSKMYSRMLMQGMGEAFWMAHSTTLPQLMGMTIGDQPIWTPPATGFQNAPGGFLLGRPIRFSEHSEEVGDLNDINLINPRGYYAATRGGVDFASSIHLYFDYDMEAFRWTFRLGGQPFMSAPVARKKGTSTLSHFVTLAARA